MALERLFRLLDRDHGSSQEHQGEQVTPLLRHLYERVKNLDLSEPRFQGQQGAVELIGLLEGDAGFMDLVSLVGEVIIQSSYFGVHVNPRGFYISTWHNSPEPEIYSIDKVLDLGNAFDPVNASTIKEGALRFIKESPNMEDGWLKRGTARTGRRLRPVSEDNFPQLLTFPPTVPPGYHVGE